VHINGADFGSSFSKLNTLMDMGRERSPEQWQGFHANCQLVTTIKQVDGYLAIYRRSIRKRPRMPAVLSVKQIKYPMCGGRTYWNTTPIGVDASGRGDDPIRRALARQFW